MMRNRQKTNRFLLLGLVLFCRFFSLSAQEAADTNKVNRLPEIQIGGDYFKTEINAAAIQTITIRQLENLPTLQLSDALKYMSGVVVKDYGGAGGMKTVSIRGLGSQHTGVSYDGIPLTDCQTGQIDLSKVALDNIASVSVVTGECGLLTPARLFSYSNIIRINSIREILSEKPVHLKIAMTAGSYGLLAPQFFFEHIVKSKKQNDRSFVWNLSADYLYSKGDYPFVMHYGSANDSTSIERRQNTDVSAFNSEANFIYRHNKYQLLHVKWYYYDSDRGLPSATIFYNLDSHQRLSNRNTFGQLNYRYQINPSLFYMLSAKFNYDFTHYVDSAYLNANGLLDNQYEQYEGYLSNVMMFIPFTFKTDTIHGTSKGTPFPLQFSLSNDLFYNQLEGNTMDIAHPRRFTTMTALAARFSHPIVSVSGNLLLTTVNNKTDNAAVGNYVHLSPAVNVSIAAHKHCHIRAFYKNIFRMPTFNDLYYREVGNLDLAPEKTHQCDLGVVMDDQRLASGKVSLSASLDGYFNLVKDKIVAFPSRNLFSWTMLNFGKVWIGGAELNANLQYQFVKKYWLRLSGNCTYQKAVDRTDPTGKTFNHQIPYTPVWSGSASLSVDMPWLTVSYSLIVCGDRYALGQNIPSNLVEGYVDHSVTIGHTYSIKDVKLGFKCELLNLANRNYEIVRNYPMQGFGWRVKILFEY